MRNRLTLLTLTLMLVLGISHAALATSAGNNCGCPDRASSKNTKRVPLAEKLNLSDRQVQQVKEINLSTYQTTKVLKVKLLDAKFERRQLMIVGTDKSAIDANNKEIENLQAQLHKAQQQKWQKIQSILTPEQQSKLKDMKGFGQHGGHCKPGCPQPK